MEPEPQIRPDQSVFEFSCSASSVLPKDFVASLKLSVRATNVLNRMCLRTLEEFLSLNEAQLYSQRSCGKTTVAEILAGVENFKTRSRAPKPSLDSPISSLSVSNSIAVGLSRMGFQSVRDVLLAPEEKLSEANFGAEDEAEIRAKLLQFLATNEKAAALLEDKNPIEYLRLSLRALAAVKDCEISTVGELVKYPTHQFFALRNFGKKSLADIHSKLLKYFVEKELRHDLEKFEKPTFRLTPRTVADEFLAGLRPDLKEVLSRRFGLWGDGGETLQDIGDSWGCTREYVRQIESKALSAIKWPGNLKLLGHFLEHVYREKFQPVLEKGCGVATEDELRASFVSLCSAPQEAISAELFFSECFFEDHSIYEERCLKIDDKVFALDSKGRMRYQAVMKAACEFLERAQKPVPISELLCRISRPSDRSPIGEDEAHRFLRVSPRLRMNEDGLCGLSTWRYMHPKTLHDMIVHALVEMGKPAHFTQIAMRIDEKFSSHAPVNVRNVHARLIYDQKTFVWQSNGVYGLSAWGLKKAPYVKDRLVEILRVVKQPLSLAQMIPQVLETCRCKESTVSAILDAHPNLFIRLDKGIYGLKQWTSE